MQDPCDGMHQSYSSHSAHSVVSNNDWELSTEPVTMLGANYSAVVYNIHVT